MQTPHLWADMRSRMNREVHVRICESLGVRFPWATRLFTLKDLDQGLKTDAIFLYNTQFGVICRSAELLVATQIFNAVANSETLKHR
jgi:hypothetical protein